MIAHPQRDDLLLAFSDLLLGARGAGVAARVFKPHLSHASCVAWSNPDQAPATSAMGVRLRHVRALQVARARAGRWRAWVIAKTNPPQLLERGTGRARAQWHTGRRDDFHVKCDRSIPGSRAALGSHAACDRGLRAAFASVCHARRVVTFWAPHKGIARPIVAVRGPSEHCNEEVIDYFRRCVEHAAQAAAIRRDSLVRQPQVPLGGAD
jgi:hypothetical protein